MLPNRNYYTNQKGFTLMELLVVVGLLGILTTGLLLTVDPIAQLQKGEDGKRKSELTQIQSALEMYRADSGHYFVADPAAASPSLIYGSSSCPASTSLSFTGATGTSTYLAKIFCDPKLIWNTGQYYYVSDGLTYTLVACLERSTDPDGTTCPGAVPAATCSGCASGNFYVVQNP